MQRISSKPSLLDLIFRQNYRARYGLLATGSGGLISQFHQFTYFYILQFFDLKPHNLTTHAWNQLQQISSKPSLLDLIFRQNYRTCYGLLARGSSVSNPHFAILRSKTQQPKNPCLEPIATDFF